MEIKVKMTDRDLFDFSMYNSYSGPTGLFNIIFTLGALFLLIFTGGRNTAYQNLLLVCCVLIFTVLQPLMLRTKSKKQAQMTGFSAPLTLTLSDEKISVEQAGVEGDLRWDQIWKAARIKSMFILRVGPTRGYLIPNRSIEGREAELVEILKKNLPANKTKGLKA